MSLDHSLRSVSRIRGRILRFGLLTTKGYSPEMYTFTNGQDHILKSIEMRHYFTVRCDEVREDDSDEEFIPGEPKSEIEDNVDPIAKSSTENGESEAARDC